MISRYGWQTQKKTSESEGRATLSYEAFSKLVQLAEFGPYGSSPTEVARFLILRELDDLMRSGILLKEERVSEKNA